MLNTCISKNMNRILFYIFLGGMLMIFGCRDQISISDKKDIINIETCPIESSRIKSSISLSQSEEYGFLNFTTRFFETEDYIEPLHGESIPEGWYALGGIGFCTENYEDYAELQDGKLVSYTYQDNHMLAQKIDTLVFQQYSGCLYQYTVDLFTAVESENLEESKLNNKYWVIFYIDNKFRKVYMMYFSCDYFSENDVRSIFK